MGTSEVPAELSEEENQWWYDHWMPIPAEIWNDCTLDKLAGPNRKRQRLLREIWWKTRDEDGHHMLRSLTKAGVPNPLGRMRTYFVKHRLLE